jgi:hypothetical protein
MRQHEMFQTTVVSFLLDRTGSMEAIKSDTIGGFNAYLAHPIRDAGSQGVSTGVC